MAILSAKCRSSIVLSQKLTFQSCFSKSSDIIPPRKILKRVGEVREGILAYNSKCFSESCSRAAIHLNCTYRFVKEVLNGTDYICIHIVLSHGTHKVACFEDMVQILLNFKVLL